MPADILLGIVTAVQGLKGEVRVKTFTEAPERLADYGVLHTSEGRKLEIAALRASKADGAVIRFKGIDDRDSAARLVNAKLLVERNALPATEADEFYHADLVGLRAQDSEGRVIGEVCAVHNHGAGDVIEIRRGDGSTLLLPFSGEFVPAVDIASGRITITEPQDIGAAEQRGVE